MSGIAAKASFDGIRYAQVWEDADVLCEALAPARGGRLLSVCSAGDNALALLTLDPGAVDAVDLSPAQLSCLRLRMGAYARLDHQALLELMGSRPSGRRAALLDEASAGLPDAERQWWRLQAGEVSRHGLAGIGRFERYFRIFRTLVLPLAHSRRTVEAIFEPRTASGREEFLDRVWNSWRWRLLLAAFFSRTAMGRLGRDPAFFEHADGDLPAHVARRIREAFVTQDPAANPYLRWLMTGTHGDALPLALRPEHFEAIRSRLGRVRPRRAAVQDLPEGAAYDGLNLSDVFEYMGEAEFTSSYAALLRACRPGARLAYWNMLAPRACPGGAAPLADASESLHRRDKAFFYSAFRVDEAPGRA